MKNTFIFLMILFCAGIVAAQPIVEISVNPVFQTGDNVKFYYQINTQVDENLSFIPAIICDKLNQSPLEEQKVILHAGTPLFGEYTWGKVDDSISDTDCNAVISFTNNYYFILRKPFQINGLDTLRGQLFICSDSNCTTRAKVFDKNESIYLQIFTEVQGVITTTRLTLPDKSTRNLILPSNLLLESKGGYSLEVTLEKNGYKTLILSDEFAVIDPNPIISVSHCNSDGVCNGNENTQTCPIDCIQNDSNVPSVKNPVDNNTPNILQPNDSNTIPVLDLNNDQNTPDETQNSSTEPKKEEALSPTTILLMSFISLVVIVALIFLAVTIFRKK